MTINDDEFALAIKNDTSTNNEINNMITDIYIENNNNKKKSNLKATSMFDPQSNGTKPKLNVSFNNDNGKRKLPFNSNDKLESTNKQTLNKKANSTSSSSSNLNSDLIKSPINFDSFACDQELKENILRRIYYILTPEHFVENGKIPPRGFLLHGPPGCGKTQLVYAIAGELNIPLLKVASTELISGVSGESEANIRNIFEKAIVNSPCILFIDEIEAISQRRETASKNMEHRIVTQLLSCFDGNNYIHEYNISNLNY